MINGQLIRYCIAPRSTIRGWDVCTVYVNAEGHEFNGDSRIKCDTKREAKSLAQRLNEQLRKHQEED